MKRRRERDPDLDPFREGVATLHAENDTTVGFLATIVDEFWTPFRPLTWRERVWWLVTWSDGRRERIEEDYPPWTLVEEVRKGRVELETETGTKPATFVVRWLSGDERSRAWARYGITEDVEAYM